MASVFWNNRMKLRYLFLTAALIQGCATNPPVSSYMPIAPTGIDAIRSKSVRIKATPTPDFVQFTNGDQATMTVGILFGPIGGGIGAAAAISHSKSRGQAVVHENAIPDPTALLVQRIESTLTSKYGSSIGDTGYEIDVATDYWALAKDDVVFNASVRLVDASVKNANGKPIAAPLALGQCRFSTRNDKDKLTADQLLDNHAEKLKQVLSQALDRCAQEFEQKVFL
jgi:hypothetical protein